MLSGCKEPRRSDEEVYLARCILILQAALYGSPFLVSPLLFSPHLRPGLCLLSGPFPGRIFPPDLGQPCGNGYVHTSHLEILLKCTFRFHSSGVGGGPGILHF